MEQSNPVSRQRGLVALGYGLGAYVAYVALVSALLLHLVASVGASALPPAPREIVSVVSPSTKTVVAITADDGLSSLTEYCATDGLSADVIVVPTLDEQERMMRALGCAP